MTSREFREIQVSSTQLAIIFLGILVIGVVIFLLGVSVGKKHAQVALKANVIAQKEPEQVKETIVTLPQVNNGHVLVPGGSLGGKESRPRHSREIPKDGLSGRRYGAPDNGQKACLQGEDRGISDQGASGTSQGEAVLGSGPANRLFHRPGLSDRIMNERKKSDPRGQAD